MIGTLQSKGAQACLHIKEWEVVFIDQIHSLHYPLSILEKKLAFAGFLYFPHHLRHSESVDDGCHAYQGLHGIPNITNCQGFWNVQIPTLTFNCAKTSWYLCKSAGYKSSSCEQLLSLRWVVQSHQLPRNQASEKCNKSFSEGKKKGPFFLNHDSSKLAV